MTFQLLTPHSSLSAFPLSLSLGGLFMLMEYYLEQYARVFARTDRDIWNYEDGCVLIGLNALWEAAGEEKYFDAMRTFIDRYIDEQGNIRLYRMEDYNLDFIPSGRVLFPLYEAGSTSAARSCRRSWWG